MFKAKNLLFLILVGKYQSFSSKDDVKFVFLSKMPVIRLKNFPNTTGSSVFIMKECWILSNVFYLIIM